MTEINNPYSVGMKMMASTMRSMRSMYQQGTESDTVPLEKGRTSQVKDRFSSLDVRKFAELTGDQNQLHTDRRYAEENGPFDEPIVHGILVMGSVSSALADFEGDIIIEDMSDLSFLKPVYIDEEVEIECEIKELDGRRAEVEISVTKTEDGSEVINGLTTLFDAQGMDLS